MKKKSLWWTLIIVGILPFAIPAVAGIYYAIVGYGGYIWPYTSGIEAFYSVVINWSCYIWPLYVLGALLIVYSCRRLYLLNHSKK